MHCLGAALSLLLLGSPAAAADQFDLICRGKSEVREIVAHYRVDVMTMQYCAGECAKPEKIQAATSELITFYDLPHDSPSDGRHYISFNRLSSVWRWYEYTPGANDRIQDIVGRCEVLNFSGFPWGVRLPYDVR